MSNLKQKIKDFFSSLFGVKPNEEVENIKIYFPEENIDLMSEIDSKRIEDLEKTIQVLSLQILSLRDEIVKNQEYVNYNSTLFELLINQIDQGNIGFIKNNVGANESEEIENPMDELLNSVANSPPKKKSELN